MGNWITKLADKVFPKADENLDSDYDSENDYDSEVESNSNKAIDDIIFEDDSEEEYDDDIYNKKSKESVNKNYSSEKVVSLKVRSSRGSLGNNGVKFVKPTRLSDATEPANLLSEGEIVIICFDEKMTIADSTRILDFIRGVVYILNAQMKSIETNSYILIPENIPAGGIDIESVEDISMFNDGYLD